MKILILRTAPDIVNMNTYNLQEIGLAKALVRKGHQCDVAYYCGKEKDHIEEISFDSDLIIKVLWLQGFGFMRECFFPTLKKYIDRYDVIQVGSYAAIISWWLNLHYPNKIVNYQGVYYCEDNRGDILKARLFDSLFLRFTNRSKMVVAAKSVLSANYVKQRGISDVTTIGVGLDVDNIIKEEVDINENDFVKRLKEQKEESRYIMYIGVLEKRRDILFLLEVFKEISTKMSNCKLVVIGKGKEEYVELCRKKIKKLELGDKIIYARYLEQKYMKEVYACADVFLLPTNYEIFGMVMLEAMYFGVPVFTTYNGGSSILISGNNGVVIEEKDPVEWASKVMKVLNDQQRADKMSMNAKRMIEKDYTWDALADKFLDVYRKRIDIE